MWRAPSSTLRYSPVRYNAPPVAHEKVPGVRDNVFQLPAGSTVHARALHLHRAARWQTLSIFLAARTRPGVAGSVTRIQIGSWATAVPP